MDFKLVIYTSQSEEKRYVCHFDYFRAPLWKYDTGNLKKLKILDKDFLATTVVIV